MGPLTRISWTVPSSEACAGRGSDMLIAGLNGREVCGRGSGISSTKNLRATRSGYLLSPGVDFIERLSWRAFGSLIDFFKIGVVDMAFLKYSMCLTDVNALRPPLLSLEISTMYVLNLRYASDLVSWGI